MSAQLETQIRRKEKEIESLNSEQDVHQHEKNHATEQYKERNENFERLRERLDQANQEIEESDKEIAGLRHELAMMRSENNASENGGSNDPNSNGSNGNNDEENNRQNALEGLSAKDCIDELIKEMSQVAHRLADPDGSSMGASELDGASSSSSASNGGPSNADFALAQVSVNYERVHEFASFQLTSTYTFEQLCSDACRYWGVREGLGTLRDAHNVMWPPQATIAEHLAERARMDGETPIVRLVARSDRKENKNRNSSNQNDRKGMMSSSSSKSNARNNASNGRNASGGSGGGGGGNSSAMGMDSDSDSEQEGDDDSMALIKEWRRMINEEMSPLFHLPRYAGQRSKFRSLSSNSSDSKHLAQKCTTCCKLMFHALFICLVTLCLFYRRRVVTSYDAKHSLDAALLDATYAGDNFTSAPSFVNFRTMRTTDEFWGWLEGPMLEVIHPQLDASSRALDVEDQQYVLGSNRIMGGVRLRQYRTGSDVSTGGCVGSSVPLVGGTTVSQVPIVKERGCYSDYSMDRQRVYVASLEDSTSTSSYGNGKSGDEGFAFQTGSTLNARSVVTDTAYYDRSAFALELPNGRGRAQNILWKLRERKWIDSSTRAVLIDFNVINLNYYTMVAATLVVDFSPGGPVVTTASTETVVLSMYQFGVGSNFWLLALGDFIVFGFVIYFLLWEILTGIILYGLAVFMQCIWNIILVVLVLCQLIMFVMILMYETTYIVEVNPALPHYVQHGDLVQLYRHITNANALVLILAFLSTFRLVQDNDSFSKIWQTIHVALGTLGAYFFVFFIIFVAFVFAGHFSFGAEIPEFSTLIGSFNMLLQMLSSNVPYDEMREVDAFMGPLYFVLYIFCVLFLMSSVFVGILNDAYSEANKYISDNGSTFWSDVVTAPFRIVGNKITGADDSSTRARRAINK